MELVYLWIDKFNSNLKNMGLNFSGEYIVNYSSKEKKLKITKNTDYIENFWGYNITNITGIIGKNGAGKTSLLDCIKGLIYDQGIMCIEKNKKYDFYQAILIVKTEEELIIVANDELINDENDIKYDLEISKKIILYGNGHIEDVQDYCITESKNDAIARIVSGSDLLKNISCVYLTNIFDLKYPLYKSEQNIYYDLSTNGILDELEKGYINLNGNINDRIIVNERPTEKSNRFNIPLTRQYKFYTLFQQLKFIGENRQVFNSINNSKFKFPNEIILTTDYSYKRNKYENFLFINEPLLRYENQEIISKFEKKFMKN